MYTLKYEIIFVILHSVLTGSRVLYELIPQQYYSDG